MKRRHFMWLTASAVTAGRPGWADTEGFADWLTGFRRRALAAGVTDQTFKAAFARARYLNDSIERDRNQAEFARSFGDYLGSAVSDTRIATGQAKLQELAPLFAQIEARFAVEPQITAAIWGMESNYGQNRGNVPLISTLATLAHEGRRGAFFEEQLIAALLILQRGDVTPDQMTGSWAGAMGHTQFIPTSYQAYAVDFTGNGRRDIWGDDPSDALASAAAYLRAFGWTAGQPWGVEVRLPQGFDYMQTGRRVSRDVDEWARLGVTGIDGQAVPDHGAATLTTPTGATGPAFLLFSNYSVIGRYNNAEAYIFGVGHLADRLRGAGPFVAPWPAQDQPLRYAERRELQERLTAAGHDTGGIDGLIGPQTRGAIMGFQRSRDLVPDGHPTLALLQLLR
ncbi:MAG: lytic murein transglycosylase [Loktanella sp.]|nr:lytic murein transglycosylase [Loktanella sp.]